VTKIYTEALPVVGLYICDDSKTIPDRHQQQFENKTMSGMSQLICSTALIPSPPRYNFNAVVFGQIATDYRGRRSVRTST